MTGSADDRVSVLAPGLRRILAPNPSPMTLDGTNTWLIGEPGEGVVVVDPGPDDAAHRERIFSVCDGSISAIVLTHRHLDHREGAPELARAAGCPVHAADPDWRIDSLGLSVGQRLEAGTATLIATPTPGHTSDSFSFVLMAPDQPDQPDRLLTGDTVLGRGTTVITHPDGDLSAYLQSLDVLAEVIRERPIAQILPGHGPVVDEPSALIATYRRHRLERLDQVRAARQAGDRTPMDVVRRVYAEVDPTVWPAAEQSVRAQLDYLQNGRP